MIVLAPELLEINIVFLSLLSPTDFESVLGSSISPIRILLQSKGLLNVHVNSYSNSFCRTF